MILSREEQRALRVRDALELVSSLQARRSDFKFAKFLEIAIVTRIIDHEKLTEYAHAHSIRVQDAEIEFDRELSAKDISRKRGIPIDDARQQVDHEEKVLQAAREKQIASLIKSGIGGREQAERSLARHEYLIERKRRIDRVVQELQVPIARAKEIEKLQEQVRSAAEVMIDRFFRDGEFMPRGSILVRDGPSVAQRKRVAEMLDGSDSLEATASPLSLEEQEVVSDALTAHKHLDQVVARFHKRFAESQQEWGDRLNRVINRQMEVEAKAAGIKNVENHSSSSLLDRRNAAVKNVSLEELEYRQSLDPDTRRRIDFSEQLINNLIDRGVEPRNALRLSDILGEPGAGESGAVWMRRGFDHLVRTGMNQEAATLVVEAMNGVTVAEHLAGRARNAEDERQIERSMHRELLEQQVADAEYEGRVPSAPGFLAPSDASAPINRPGDSSQPSASDRREYDPRIRDGSRAAR